jgi:tyrosyl-tRNA synthetase
MLLQAYDFVELYKQHKCILQFGGSEQWGNIVSGIDLGRKMLDVELFGITTPLITNSSGTKMGKTADGAIWLNAELLSPYDYWQFWRNTNDADVIKFLKIYTEIPVDQINNMANNDINELKKILADHATTLCHGSSAADMARQQSEAIFEQSDINSMATYELIGDEMLYDILVKLNCASSNSAAKRLISGKAIKINNITIVDEKHIINKTGNEYILTISKKKYFKLI